MISAPRGKRRSVAWIYGFGALGGLLYGYDTGVIAGALLFVDRDFGLTPVRQGLVVSSLLFGALVGALAAGSLSDRWGRRRVLLAAAGVFLCGGLGAAAAPDSGTLIGFRVVVGVAVGLASVLVPIYLSEMAPAARRGALTSLYQVMISSGIFLAYVVDYALSGIGAWRIMLGLAVVPSVVLLLGMWRQSESPRWLLAQGREDAAREVLSQLRRDDERDAEIAEIRRAAAEPISPRAIWGSPWLRRAALLAVVMAALQQFLGVNAIVYYAPSILRAAGLGSSAAISSGAGMALLTLVATVAATQLVDRLGRRVLLLGGAVGMTAAMVIMGAVFATGGLRSEVGRVAAVMGMAGFKAAFSLSWGPLVWVVLPEILPLRIRGSVMGVATAVNWMANLGVSFAFPQLLAAGTGSAFWAFAGCGVVAFGIVMVWLPETSRRSLEQIEADAHE